MLYLIAIVGAFVAGAINTLAGNGSAITLTILTELLGLPGTVANGTNRVGVLTQSLAGSWAFYRKGRLQLQHSGFYIALTSLGGDPTLAVAACCIMRARDLVLISIGAGLAIRWIRAPYGGKPHRPLGNA